MDKTGYFKLTKDEENYLWDKAVIVLDTSTLGNLYCMAEEPKQTLLEIFDIVKKRVWLPAHVVYEYKKNRNDLIERSFESYFLPKQGVYVNKYEAEMAEFLKENSSDNYHPYLELKSLKVIEAADKIIRENLKIIKDEIKAQYTIRQQALREVLTNDTIQKFVESVSKGEPFSFNEQVEIAKEGELRYRNLIPPGYEDAPPFYNDKKGLQRYGDLIVWKEILRHAKENHVPILFVCNDLKNDWFYFEGKRATSTPRHELIKEFQDETGQLFWMYSLKDFINKLEEKYKDAEALPLFPKLEMVKRVLINNENKQKGRKYKNPSALLVVKCEECDDIITIRKDEIDWEWEGVSVEEREMGEEVRFEHEEYVECENGHSLTIRFIIWEYPAGVINCTEVECDGGEVEEEFDFEDTLPVFVPEDEEEVCEKCGIHGPTNHMGLCPECYRDYKEFMGLDGVQ